MKKYKTKYNPISNGDGHVAPVLHITVNNPLNKLIK